MIITKNIFIADLPHTFVSRSIPEARLKFGGIPGDRHFGITFPSNGRQPMYPRGTEILNRRQISILAQEELDLIAKNLDVNIIKPEWLGANILLNGLPNLTTLPVHTRLLFASGASLICEGENKPCIHPGKHIQAQYPGREKLDSLFIRAAMGKRGIVCSVEKEGAIFKGDVVTLA